MLFNYTSYRNKVNALLVIMLLCLPFCVNAQIISTLAGNGKQGSSGDGGFASYATFNGPMGLLMDGRGTLYIADQDNNRIRVINSYGVVKTIAGTGSSGGSTGDGGPAVKAKINHPTGMAMDKAGNLYIADSWNNKIRKIDVDGKITTVAGNGVAGYSGDNIPAVTAKLNNPKSVAIDPLGNLIIADCNNCRIRRVDTAGIITTIAGTGDVSYYGNGVPATASKLNKPAAVAIDKDGNILIADTYNNLIRKITTDSLIHNIAGNGTPGYGGDNSSGFSQLNRPSGLAVDGVGNVFIADMNNNRVRKIDTGGTITTVAGNGSPGSAGDGGSSVEAELYVPTCVAVDSAGNLYVGQSDNKIRYVYLDPVENDQTMDVFPVPCKMSTTLFMPSMYEELVTVFIMNADGRLVSKLTGLTNRFVNVHLELSGVYMIYGVSKHGKWKGKAINLDTSAR